mgnify:CR=1 FL=1
MGFPYDEINIFYSNLAQSTRHMPEHIYFENGQPDQEKSRKNVPKKAFFGQNLRSEYGYLRPREASSAAIASPKSQAITFLTPWGHVGRGRWLWSGQIHLPWPSRALKMDKKNCRKFGPAVQPAATLWQVCGVMPATPEAIKSTTDAAGHAGENRNAFIGFDGLEMDSITTFPL